MADRSLNQLPNLAALSSSDSVLINQAGLLKKILFEQLALLLNNTNSIVGDRRENFVYDSPLTLNLADLEENIIICQQSCTLILDSGVASNYLLTVYNENINNVISIIDTVGTTAITLNSSTYRLANFLFDGQRWLIHGVDNLIVFTPDIEVVDASFSWSFENNLTDEGGHLTFIPIGNPSFPSGVIGQSVKLDYFANLSPAPDVFRLTWDKPWAFSGWVYFSASNSSMRATFYTESALEVSSSAPISYEFSMGRTQRRFTIRDASNSSESKILFASSSQGSWHFTFAIYDPINPKKIIIGTNDTDVTTLTFTKDFRDVELYNSNQTLRLTKGFSNDLIDNFTFWNELKTVDQMLAIWNQGNQALS